jgi:hypothetical protein
MSEHTFRNPHLFQRLPLRDYLRTHYPDGSNGFVLEDLDLVVRHYGINYRTDSIGRILLIELKHPGSSIGTAQRKTFGLIDSLMRRGDPKGERYLGYFQLNATFDEKNNMVFPVQVNGIQMDEPRFRRWITGEDVLPSLFLT